MLCSRRTKTMAIGLTLLVLGVILVSTLSQAQTEIPLADLAIQPGILADNPERIKAGMTHAGDPSQPLSRATADLPQAKDNLLLNYKEAYRVEGFDEKRGVYVGNYLYRYTDASQVEAVAQAFFDSVTAYKGELLSDDLGGKQVLFIGSAEDVIYWHIGVKDNVLILLIVNGPVSPQTQAAFQDLIKALPGDAVQQ